MTACEAALVEVIIGNFRTSMSEAQETMHELVKNFISLNCCLLKIKKVDPLLLKTRVFRCVLCY
jgi:hypothetical protein